MAKKKVDVKEKEELKHIDEDFFDNEDIETHYPDIEKIKSDSSKKPSSDSFEGADVLDEEELLNEDFSIEESEPEITYKYLNLTLNRGNGENDYTIRVEGQSHGFLNVFVKHLLQVEGVNAAAYKVTQIEAPELFIRLEKGFKIKDILHKGINLLRNEIADAQKSFSKLI
jgi:DNA-directed RNA polymerase subunit L